MKVPLLDLKAQYAGLRDAVRPVMDAVCDDQYFILGPRVQAFEKRMAAYCGTAEAIGVSSGSDALLMGLMALGIGEGDAVLTSPFTFFATAGAIVRTGATPVFADIDPVTFNLSPAAAAQAVEEAAGRFPGKRLKAMIPVHLYGQ
jgi:dTDP-4-amino-4,6-dideoxygalactose transaminase